MKQPNIIFIPTPSKHPLSGGQEYELRLFEFLKREFKNVEPIEIRLLRTRAKNDHEILMFGLGSLIRNLLYLLKITKKHTERTVILEDHYHSTDLFLFNFVIRRIKKNVCVVPVVHHLYYSLRREVFQQTLLKALERVFLNESDWIITNSEATKKAVKGLLRKGKTFLVAYPGVSREKIADLETDFSGSKERRILNLLAVGSMTERKDYETLLKAVKILIDQYGRDNIFVSIVGSIDTDKELLAKTLKTVDSLQLTNHVAFEGIVDSVKLRDLYATSEIFVSTSLHEGFGMAIAEAMNNHLPVVATNCGALPYLVEDGVNGFLVSPKDYGQLAEKIELLLESEELRKKMGTKGYHKAKKFDWDQSFGKIHEKLLEICES